MSKQHSATVLWERTLVVREEAAQKVFALHEVGFLVKAAVERGASHVVIRQDMRVDLSMTRAALQAVCHYQKLGFFVGWVWMGADGKRKPNEDDALYPVMEIDWGGKRAGGIEPVIREKDLQGVIVRSELPK